MLDAICSIKLKILKENTKTRALLCAYYKVAFVYVSKQKRHKQRYLPVSWFKMIHLSWNKYELWS